MTYRQVRLAEEEQFSAYSFDHADAVSTRKQFDLIEAEASRLLAELTSLKGRTPRRFPVLQIYDLCLKCSHLFNVLDARGAISVTERAAMIGRVRKLATQVARAWLDQQRRTCVQEAGGERMKPYSRKREASAKKREQPRKKKVRLRTVEKAAREIFFLEIGCEEIPAGMIPKAAAELKAILVTHFSSHGLVDEPTVEAII
jgi:hypothetical protein